MATVKSYTISSLFTGRGLASELNMLNVVVICAIQSEETEAFQRFSYVPVISYSENLCCGRSCQHSSQMLKNAKIHMRPIIEECEEFQDEANISNLEIRGNTSKAK